MNKEHRGLRKSGAALLLFLLLAASVFSGLKTTTVLADLLVSDTATSTSTTTTTTTKKKGFVKENGRTYYYDADGTLHKGWLTLNGKKYYFTKGAGVMCTGWLQDTKGNKRYFNTKTGAMYTGWVSYTSGKKRYFDTRTGVLALGWFKVGNNRYYANTKDGYIVTGFQKIGSYYRYFYSQSGALARGWLTNSKGEKRYFYTNSSTAKDGMMATGKKTIGGKTYYFNTSNGKMQVSAWKTIGGKKYYFNSSGVMVTGTVTINGTKQKFGSDGVYIGVYSSTPTGSTNGQRTIKNYLLGALMPVGKVLYVWGGGWNNSTTKGITTTQKNWYKNQSSNYNYENYSDLSVTNRAKGFDCSGFVGWAAYQVMHTRSNVGSGYTVVSGDVGSYYKSMGWGTTMNQGYMSSKNYVVKAGDIGYNGGHVWIALGQCRDKSVVLVHSTPQAGVQISGTTTPSGSYSSQAITLAKRYMSRYNTSKYEYHSSAGNYLKQYSFFRWNRSTLADPDGYMSKYADAILADLFG